MNHKRTNKRIKTVLIGMGLSIAIIALGTIGISTLIWLRKIESGKIPEMICLLLASFAGTRIIVKQVDEERIFGVLVPLFWLGTEIVGGMLQGNILKKWPLYFLTLCGSVIGFILKKQNEWDEKKKSVIMTKI